MKSDHSKVTRPHNHFKKKLGKKEKKNEHSLLEYRLLQHILVSMQLSSTLIGSHYHDSIRYKKSSTENEKRKELASLASGRSEAKGNGGE